MQPQLGPNSSWQGVDSDVALFFLSATPFFYCLFCQLLTAKMTIEIISYFRCYCPPYQYVSQRQQNKIHQIQLPGGFTDCIDGVVDGRNALGKEGMWRYRAQSNPLYTQFRNSNWSYYEDDRCRRAWVSHDFISWKDSWGVGHSYACNPLYRALRYKAPTEVVMKMVDIGGRKLLMQKNHGFTSLRGTCMVKLRSKLSWWLI